ncbi:MAG: hypothetical protein QXX77_10555 [Candidatus Methanosuratincola sp.]|jgi:type IV pilus assembly protein PilB
MTRKPLGRMFVEAGLISSEQLKHALNQHAYYGEKIGQTLLRLGYITEQDLLRFLGRQHGTPALDLYRQVIDERAVDLVPKEIAERYRLIPIGYKTIAGEKRLVLGMANPNDRGAIEHVGRITGCSVFPVFVREEHLKWIINHYYKAKGLRLTVELEGGESHSLDEEEVIDLGRPLPKPKE